MNERRKTNKKQGNGRKMSKDRIKEEIKIT